MQDDLRSVRPMEINLAELKHSLDTESDQSTTNIENNFGHSRKSITFKKLGLVAKFGWELLPHSPY